MTVVDADGQRIPWPEVSRVDDEGVRDLMRRIVNRLCTFHVKAGERDFQWIVDHWLPVARGWDLPGLDEAFMREIQAARAEPRSILIENHNY